MNIHAELFWGLYALWLVMEIVVNLRAYWLRRKSLGQVTKADSGSVWVILGGMYVFILCAWLLSVNGIGLMPSWVGFLGNVVMVFGLVMRYSAIMQLGRYFSSTVQISSDQTVIQSGWYRHIRHPAYTGGVAYCGWTGAGIGYLGWDHHHRAWLLRHLLSPYSSRRESAFGSSRHVLCELSGENLSHVAVDLVTAVAGGQHSVGKTARHGK